MIALAILAFLYIGWMFSHLGYLTNFDNAYGYILYLLFAVELNDIAAFTFGDSLANTRCVATSAPKKRGRGALGALAISLALPWILIFSLPELSTTERILTGLIVGIGGQLGDLAISVIKRDLAIKDMGKVLVGHGGLLDRIDSLIFVAPLFMHLIDYFHEGA